MLFFLLLRGGKRYFFYCSKTSLNCVFVSIITNTFKNMVVKMTEQTEGKNGHGNDARREFPLLQPYLEVTGVLACARRPTLTLLSVAIVPN